MSITTATITEFISRHVFTILFFFLYTVFIDLFVLTSVLHPGPVSFWYVHVYSHNYTSCIYIWIILLIKINIMLYMLITLLTHDLSVYMVMPNQLCINNSPHLHVFGLWEKPEALGLKPDTRWTCKLNTSKILLLHLLTGDSKLFRLHTLADAFIQSNFTRLLLDDCYKI